jgi:hypothetical protein
MLYGRDPMLTSSPLMMFLTDGILSLIGPGIIN